MAESAKEGPSVAKPRGRRIELSMAQVAGSAAATVTAAVLASFLGVYGTIIGAAVMSVVATSVGAVYQHLFRRTGEQLREVGVLTRPRRRARPAGARAAAAGDAGAPGAVPAYDRAGHRDEAAAVRPDAAAALPAAALPGAALPGAAPYSPGTVHGTRWRGRRRLLPAAAAVFAVALVAITGIELVTGPIAGWFGKAGGSAPSISQVLGGGTASTRRPAGPATPTAPAAPGTATAGPAASGTPTGGGATPTPGGTTASPGRGQDTPSATATAPATAPAQGTPSAPPATPSATAVPTAG